MNILLVDDSSTQRRIQKTILIGNSFPEKNIYEAENGYRAIDRLKKNNFGLIILDWNMPGLNGLEFMLDIRKHEEWKNIPVVMVTSEAEKSFLLKAIQAGVTNYIVKPINGDIFWKKISQYILWK